MIAASARLLRLLSLLQARRDWPGAELAARLGVTPRTLRRDIDRLRSLGYPVRSSPGTAGGYRLGAGAALPPLQLDDDEALAVALGLRLAATAAVSGMQETAVRALAKLESLLPARLRRRVRALHAAVAPMGMAGPPVGPDLLTALATACREHERLRLRYRDHEGRASEREIEPHGLVCAGTRWYLVAWDLGRADWRTFRVDRIAGTPQAGARFLPRRLPEGDLAAYVSRTVSTQPYPIRARVVLHAPVERMREHVPPLAASLHALDAGRCVLEAGAHSLDALGYHIARLDVEFEVESPPELAARMHALGARLLRAAGAAACGAQAR